MSALRPPAFWIIVFMGFVLAQAVKMALMAAIISRALPLGADEGAALVAIAMMATIVAGFLVAHLATQKRA